MKKITVRGFIIMALFSCINNATEENNSASSSEPEFTPQLLPSLRTSSHHDDKTFYKLSDDGNPGTEEEADPLVEEDIDHCSSYFMKTYFMKSFQMISPEERRALYVVLGDGFTWHVKGNYANEIANIRAYLGDELDSPHKRSNVETIIKRLVEHATKRAYKNNADFWRQYEAQKREASYCIKKWKAANENKAR